MANEQGPPKLTRVPTKIDAATPPLRLAVYGEGGVGKTQLALTFPTPLVVNTDGGLVGGAVEGVVGETWTPEKYRDLNALYFWLKAEVAKRGYETIVIDTIDTLARILLHEAISLPTRDREANAEDRGLQQATQQDYGKVATALDRFLTQLKQLSQTTGVHVVLTSAVREPDIERGRTKRTFDVQPAVEAILLYWADVYGELTIEELGKDKVESRVLWTNPADRKRKNKTRYAPLLPGVTEPSFGKIRNLIDSAAVASANTPKPEKGAK